MSVLKKLLPGGRDRQRGFMLVESLVAVTIVGTGILAAVTSLSTSSKATIEAREGATAAWVVTSQIELIKASPFVAVPGAYPTVTPPTGFTVTCNRQESNFEQTKRSKF